ncbi:MAG TPA: phosphatase PAP2 family protein [Sphingomicrobium sp.]|nr:phosphatase PAP2 family protein [Sphingomicrobium sp.]
MSQLPERFVSWVLVVAALLVFVVAGLVGGPDNMRDVAAIHSLEAYRTAHIALTAQAIMVTHFGGAPMLVAILLAATAWLAYSREWRPAISLVVIVIGGRIAVELLKLAIQRPRPFFSPYPVEIASLSFPSGHAANTLITFLALALIAAPPKGRAAAIAVAAATSLLVGLTRPLLGVHWPSDVVGGWAFGIAWVVVGVALSRRWIVPAK